MPNLLEEITKTFLRLANPAKRRSVRTDDAERAPDSSSKNSAASSGSSDIAETIVQPDSREGQQFGVFRILKRLGFGGMGHVYLALDTRLGRQVALKFIPGQLASDRDLLRRFEQEARTASALNHPNILTIYEIGECEGEHFIAGEFIDGKTLRVAMEQQAIDAGTAIDIASQVASALMAAHSAGVIHRDLKPGNIMIRPDGYVKVIDFGLAKRFETSAPHAGRPTSVTRPGAILGTVSYMSPEQARGDPVDHRTDLWSLGVVLYEMLAHRRPFTGDTESHLIVSILDHAPVPLPAKSLPAGLARIVERALAKNPGQRYQSAAEMLGDLHQVSQTSGLGSSIRPTLVFRRRAAPAKWLSTVALLAFLLIAFAVWWWPLGGKTRLLGPNWFQVESVRQLTFNGRTTLASISPDGKYLAFAAGDPNGLQTLFIKQVNSPSEAVKIAPRRIFYVGVTFSPDDQIFVVEKDEKMLGRLYALPILGDSATPPLVTDIDGPVAFSPSGDRFAFVRNIHEQRAGREETESAIWVASRDASDVQKLASVKTSAFSERIAWSPKGDLIAAILFSDQPQGIMLDLIDLTGHQSLKTLPDWRAPGQISWMPDGATLVLTAVNRGEASNRGKLREIAVKSGATRDITNDLAGYRSASLTRDGSQLAAIKLAPRAVLWISTAGNFETGESAPAEADEHPSLAWYDPTHVLVSSYRGGFPNLWLFDIATQARAGLTNDPHVEQSGVQIPGTNSIVFSSNRTGQFHLWRFDPDANRFTQLTSGANYEDSPGVTPDGQWIAYTSWISNLPHLRKVRVTGGPTSLIASYPAENPQISPDGRSIACKIKDPNTSQWTIAIIPFDASGQPRPIPEADLPVHWSPDGSALTTIRTDAKGVSNIWRVQLDGSAPRQLTRFEDQTILNFAWSPAGDRLACLREIKGADVALFIRQKAR